MENTEKKLPEEVTPVATEKTAPNQKELEEQINALQKKLSDEPAVKSSEALSEKGKTEAAEESPVEAEEVNSAAAVAEEPSSAAEESVDAPLSPLDELKLLAEKEAEQWDYLPKPMGKLKKKRNHTFIKVFVPMLLAFSILFVIVCNSVFGSGWFTNRFTDNDNRMEFTFPVAGVPKLEDRYYQADGRYTVEGVAKAVTNSIVTIECFIQGQPLMAASQGSGIIMSEDGYIITNAHVIENATLSILVRTADGLEFDATIVGSDIKSDLAIIKANANKLQPAQFGNSDELVLGEQVVAIGSPAGLEGTVTTGIVSGLDRPIRVDTNNIEMSCIQIDAAINPGNSGGALINMWGQVVGITSSKMDSIDFDNIGFAIEMSAATPILEQLIEHGRVLGRPKIGISFYEVSDALGAQNGSPGGLYIAEISPDCDIANSGLQIDDIIVEMNGISVRSASDVYDIILEMAPGDTVTAKVLRLNDDGEFDEFEISFKLMEDDSSFIEVEE